MKRILRWLSPFLLAYFCVAGIMMFIETWLIYPIPATDKNPVKPSFVHEEVWLESDDGIRLHGWYLPHGSAKHSVLFLHGNGEDVSHCGPEMARWRDSLAVNILVMSYRGYGLSGGKPAEAALIRDGLLATQWLAKRNSLKPGDVVLWGRSIGGGVAAGIAASTSPKAMIMECTFDSLANVAAEQFPWLPVRWLMKNQYRSSDRLANFQGTFIQWHGDEDSVVPLPLAKRLFESVASNNKVFILGEGYGHNDEPPEAFKAEVRRFFVSKPSPNAL